MDKPVDTGLKNTPPHQSLPKKPYVSPELVKKQKLTKVTSSPTGPLPS